MKAVSPIIAVILLLVITISLVGVAFLFFSRTTEQTGEQVGGVAEQQLKQLGADLKIDSAVVLLDGSGKVYIRNTGSVPIPASALGFYVNDQPVAANSAATTIEPNKVAEFTVTTPLNINDI